ncbi:hypothetical protein QBC44DRAFT_332185 [Cladorrhinum sp. PSN332]|nr:hypothetical protein QBC44DRAFT_332185 [Cladorrhinum sp. PSN332]
MGSAFTSHLETYMRRFPRLSKPQEVYTLLYSPDLAELFILPSAVTTQNYSKQRISSFNPSPLYWLYTCTQLEVFTQAKQQPLSIDQSTMTRDATGGGVKEVFPLLQLPAEMMFLIVDNLEPASRPAPAWACRALHAIQGQHILSLSPDNRHPAMRRLPTKEIVKYLSRVLCRVCKAFHLPNHFPVEGWSKRPCEKDTTPERYTTANKYPQDPYSSAFLYSPSSPFYIPNYNTVRSRHRLPPLQQQQRHPERPNARHVALQKAVRLARGIHFQATSCLIWRNCLCTISKRSIQGQDCLFSITNHIICTNNPRLGFKNACSTFKTKNHIHSPDDLFILEQLYLFPGRRDLCILLLLGPS